MIDPLTLGIGLVAWLAFKKQSNSQYGVMTPEREEVYGNALEFLQDPLKLNKLAQEFQREGLKVQAAMLKKRAEWRSRTPAQEKAHEEIFKKGMVSTNVHAILNVANAFESMTATARAAQLRNRAKEVQLAQEEAAKKTASEETAAVTEKVKPIPKQPAKGKGEKAKVTEVPATLMNGEPNSKADIPGNTDDKTDLQ